MYMRINNVFAFVSAATLLMVACLAGVFLGSAGQASAAKGFATPRAKLTRAVAVDVSPALRSLPRPPKARASSRVKESDEERGPVVISKGFAGDAAVQHFKSSGLANIPSPLLTFEGVSNADNLSAYGFRVAPPDLVGAVGPDHYVEMINLVLAVYDKQGNRLVGPTKIGDFWQGLRCQTAPTPQVTPLCCTTNTRIAGFCPSSPLGGPRSITVSRFRRPKIPQVPTSVTRSLRGSSSPTTRSTAPSATRLCSLRAISGPQSSTASVSTR